MNKIFLFLILFFLFISVSQQYQHKYKNRKHWLRNKFRHHKKYIIEENDNEEIRKIHEQNDNLRKQMQEAQNQISQNESKLSEIQNTKNMNESQGWRKELSSQEVKQILADEQKAQQEEQQKENNKPQLKILDGKQPQLKINNIPKIEESKNTPQKSQQLKQKVVQKQFNKQSKDTVSEKLVEVEEFNQAEADAATEKNFKIMEQQGADSYAYNYDPNEVKSVKSKEKIQEKPSNNDEHTSLALNKLDKEHELTSETLNHQENQVNAKAESKWVDLTNAPNIQSEKSYDIWLRSQYDRVGSATENSDPTGSLWATSIKTGKASEGHEIDKKVLDDLNYKTPQYIYSLNYVPKSSDSLTEGVHEAEILDNRGLFTKIGDYFKYYYDPLISKVYGDIKICETIKSPNFCTQQNVCGWCDDLSRCVPGDENRATQAPCEQYVFAPYGGWNPKVEFIDPNK